MQNITSQTGGWGHRLLWDFAFKNRKALIILLTLLILITGALLIKAILELESKVTKLKRFEPIYVLAYNRDLAVGEVLQKNDLKVSMFYAKEYKQINYQDQKDKLNKPALVQATYDQTNEKISNLKDYTGRVIQVPVLSGSLLRQEHLASVGTLPGLSHLISDQQTLVDVSVAQTGFNIFIRPNDKLKLYSNNKVGSKLLSKAKVILVNGLGLGKAPLQVEINPKASRYLTLAVPKDKFKSILQAQKSKTLALTYANNEEKTFNSRAAKKRNVFQTLTFISGNKKEVLYQ